ncbi:MAG: TRAP transporter substrate-binding protein DctP [Spirochaetaceae bacterium]
MTKRFVVLLVLAAFLFSAAGVFAGGEQEAGEEVEVIETRLASEEVEGDFMTVWAENFAEYMEEETDGRYQIDVYPYGSLGDTRDINELAQLGVVEFVFSDFAWISSFVPQAQVLALHYLWPREKIGEVLEWVVQNGDSMELLEEHFRDNGLVPLGIVYEGWQWITAKDPIESLDDMDGVKTRVMGSKLLVENYRSYGFSPTPMDYGEVYSGLQTGLIDAQVNPLFANYSMKFYEVTDYFVQMWAEPFLGIPTVNMQHFDLLPEEYQQLMRDFWADSVVDAAEWIDERNESDREKIMEDRSSIEWYEFDDEQVAEATEIARSVDDRFIEIGGEGAEELLETLKADIDAAKAAVGVE